MTTNPRCPHSWVHDEGQAHEYCKVCGISRRSYLRNNRPCYETAPAQGQGEPPKRVVCNGCGHDEHEPGKCGWFACYCVPATPALADANWPLDRLKDFVDMVYEWAAKYPLQGPKSEADNDAASTIYCCCEGAYENLSECSERLLGRDALLQQTALSLDIALGEIRTIDEALARRPALGDLKERYAKIERACAMAGRAEQAESGRDQAREALRLVNLKLEALRSCSMSGAAQVLTEEAREFVAAALSAEGKS